MQDFETARKPVPELVKAHELDHLWVHILLKGFHDPIAEQLSARNSPVSLYRSLLRKKLAQMLLFGSGPDGLKNYRGKFRLFIKVLIVELFAILDEKTRIFPTCRMGNDQLGSVGGHAFRI